MKAKPKNSNNCSSEPVWWNLRQEDTGNSEGCPSGAQSQESSNCMIGKMANLTAKRVEVCSWDKIFQASCAQKCAFLAGLDISISHDSSLEGTNLSSGNNSGAKSIFTFWNCIPQTENGKLPNQSAMQFKNCCSPSGNGGKRFLPSCSAPVASSPVHAQQKCLLFWPTQQKRCKST